jgi:hypothetical protein
MLGTHDAGKCAGRGKGWLVSTFPNTTLSAQQVQAVQKQTDEFWSTAAGAQLLTTKSSLPISSYRNQVRSSARLHNKAHHKPQFPHSVCPLHDYLFPSALAGEQLLSVQGTRISTRSIIAVRQCKDLQYYMMQLSAEVLLLSVSVLSHKTHACFHARLEGERP